MTRPMVDSKLRLVLFAVSALVTVISCRVAAPASRSRFTDMMYQA